VNKKRRVKHIIIREVIRIKGKVGGRKNTIQAQMLTDMAERIKNNLATPAVNGRVELYYGGSLVKSIPVTQADIALSDIAGGKELTIQVQDTSTDAYDVDELHLISAVSGYDGSGGSAVYSIYTLEAPDSKSAEQIYIITWTFDITAS